MWANGIRSIRGESYILVTVDDFSRFTWLDFLKEKGEALTPLSKHCKGANAVKLSNCFD